MLFRIWRNHKATLLVGALALFLAVGWTTRELVHAGEKSKALASKTVNLADIKIQDFVFEGKPRGQVGIYFDGHTAGTRNFVTGIFHLKANTEPHPIHKHPEEEILIVAKGKGEITCDGKITKVGPGSVMFTAPEAPHSIRNTSDEVLTFYFVKWIGVGRDK
jgi:mannose-6-phosphate isomerase-like protein (cupin superfamily)